MKAPLDEGEPLIAPQPAKANIHRAIAEIPAEAKAPFDGFEHERGGAQKAAWPGARGKGMTSRMLAMPVA